jgi:hypothetical protein
LFVLYASVFVCVLIGVGYKLSCAVFVILIVLFKLF